MKEDLMNSGRTPVIRVLSRRDIAGA